jgi:hypothetical protein
MLAVRQEKLYPMTDRLPVLDVSVFVGNQKVKAAISVFATRVREVLNHERLCVKQVAAKSLARLP